MVKDFSCLLENKFIKFEGVSWRKLLCRFSNIINKDDKKDATKEMILDLISGLNQPISAQKVIISLETAIKLNNFDDVKVLMQTEHYNSKEELQEII